MIKEITDNEYESEVVNSNEMILVDFWAEWCGPCKMLTPILEQLAEDMGDNIKIVKMNIDENPESPSALGIRSIPTMMLFKNGKQLGTKVGVLPKNSIKEWIESFD
ncbi:MAG: thioredoxin [Rickettsiales bacterium]|nr:MAG: thioredoxin [Rickettsiales bacterium]